jgi:hypothetical protein
MADPGSLEPAAKGAEAADVIWTFLEPSRESMLGESSQW